MCGFAPLARSDAGQRPALRGDTSSRRSGATAARGTRAESTGCKNPRSAARWEYEKSGLEDRDAGRAASLIPQGPVHHAP